jgi:hypothetical protein
MLQRKEKKTRRRRGERYYQRNGNASEEVERVRAKGKWIKMKSRMTGTKTQISKKVGRESNNPDIQQGV